MKPWALLCNVIQSEMGLDVGQVYVYENRFKIPPDDRLYVAIGILDRRCISNSMRPTPSNGGMTQDQFSAWWALLTINLLSKGTDARDRAEEAVLALKSIAMQQACELNAFRFGELPKSFNNVTSVEGSAIPYRFVASVAVNYSVSKSNSIGYYDVFGEAEVTSEP